MAHTLDIRRANTRGANSIGWLDARHSFSFGRYIDRTRMGFRSLRVLNDDRVAPSGGFAPHDHQDMEIVTLVLEGALQHRDSMGNGSVLYPGHVQRMTAGRGVTHSEFNASNREPLHLLQIWIHPAQKGLEPGYEESAFNFASLGHGFHTLAAPIEGYGEPVDAAAVRIHQDATILLGRAASGRTLVHTVREGRGVYLHVFDGSIEVDGETLDEGDAVALDRARELTIDGREHGGLFLLFDLA